MHKKINSILGGLLILAVSTSSAVAENGLKAGEVSLGIDTNTSELIYGKYHLASDLAVLAGLGFGIKGGDASGSDVSFAVGARKYIKSADFAPFIGGFMQYANTNSPTTIGSTQTDLALLAEVGAEYFFAKQLSFEGAARFGYTSTDVKTLNQPTVKTTNIGTSRASIRFNFYF